MTSMDNYKKEGLSGIMGQFEPEPREDDPVSHQEAVMDLDEDLLNMINPQIIDSVVLVHVECYKGNVKNIKVLKNDGIVYAVSDQNGISDLAPTEKDIINKININHYGEVKKWVNSWYDFLIDHLSRIKEESNYSSYHNIMFEEGLTTLYYVKNGEPIELGSYSKKTVCRSLNDSEALKIIWGNMQEDSLFWEGTCSTDDNTVYPGKEKCNFLRDVRKKIAEANNIDYKPAECHHKGPCMGTCPVCDSEIKYIDDALQKKIKNGENIALNGISEEDLLEVVKKINDNEDKLYD